MDETFKLCKAVYELFPEWDDASNYYVGDMNYATKKITYEICPSSDDAVADKYRFDFKNKTLCYESGYEYETIEYLVGNYVPLYASDYLLEKLKNERAVSVYWDGEEEEWNADSEHQIGESFGITADTPLKALLKLVLALKKAGDL